MKSITTVAVLLLIGIIGSLLAANYYVNFYKPSQKASVATTIVDFPLDSVKVIPKIVEPAAPSAIVPTNSTATKSAAQPTTTSKQTAPVTPVVPKSADVVAVPPAKPIVPAKVVPKTVAPDAGLAAKGGETVSGLTKGLHYVIIGSFADEKNAKIAMQNYVLKNLSIHKDGKLYRVSAGAFATTADAKRRMNELQRQSVESMIIQH